MAQADIVFRDFVTDGVPSSGTNKPKKAEIRQLFAGIDAAIGGFQAGGGVVFQTKAAMTLTYAANQMAWVVGDTITANNGIYQKVGASGSGSWTRVGDLPYSFARMVDAGAGTGNAIQVTSTIPTSPAVLRTAIVFASNTGNVTVSENGAAPKPLLTSSGNQIVPGGLVAGMSVAYLDDGANFRLLSDQTSTAIQAAAEAAAASAAGYAALALSNWATRRFAGNGVEKYFDLGINPGSGNNCFVSIEGVLQDTTTYSLVGTVLTFTTAPPGDGIAENIEARMGTAIEVGAPADGSVTNPKLGSNAVNARTIDGADAEAIKAKLDLRPLRGYLYGLKISNNATDAANDIDISTGEATSDGATQALMTLSSAITKRIDANWAVGTSQGGLDTGSAANGTFYYVYLIQRSDTGVVDVLMSASSSAPTMPANYDRRRRVGAVVRGTGTLLGFTQDGDYFWYNTNVEDVSAATLGTSDVDYVLSVPRIAGVKAIITGQVNNTGTWVLELHAKGLAASPVFARGAAGALSGFGQTEMRVDSAAKVTARSSVASSSLSIWTIGWVDRRGRDA